VARLTLALAATLLSALAGAGAAPATASGITVTTIPSAGTSVQQGIPFTFTARVSSDENLADEQVTFMLSRPGSPTTVPVTRDPITVSAGGTVDMKQQSVVTSQWFRELGRFQVTPTFRGSAAGPPLTFEVQKAPLTVPVFSDVTTRLGLLTSVPHGIELNLCSHRTMYAAGAAWGDVNGDGKLDLFVPRGNLPAQLFINRGKASFRDEARARGVAGDGTYAVGATFADVDSDGDRDLYVARGGPDVLYLNNGKGKFKATNPGTGDYAHDSASFADYDRDGKLDLYVTSYAGCVGSELYGQPDQLMHGNGDGTFSDASSLMQPDYSSTPGLSNGLGFQAAWFDYNGDGRQDLYLANDYLGPTPDRNRLWRNDGRGAGGKWHFTDVSVPSGTFLRMNAMGIGVGDYDHDGRLDLAVTNIGGNRLLHNNGDGTFTDASSSTGVSVSQQETGRLSVTWGTLFGDFNLDGWEDLYVAAGDLKDERSTSDPVTQQNQTLVNVHGSSFLNLSAVSGAGDLAHSRGVSTADYDRDGRLDLFVVDQAGTANAHPHLFRNVTPRGQTHWLEVNTVGTRSNRDGCGARITAAVSGASLVREVFCGSVGLASGSDKVVHFGLGPAKKVARLTISWPSGLKQVLRNVKPDRLLTITEPRV
jgi:hypothetical protein